MARRDPQRRERRRQGIRDRVQETFGPGHQPPPADRTGKIIEALVAFVLGTGFWRLVVSDSWVVSIVFGALLAALLFSYGLFRARLEERAEHRDRSPRDGRG